MAKYHVEAISDVLAGGHAVRQCAESEVELDGEFSRSALIEMAPSADQWQFTEERADLNEIRALNRLLALPATDGLSLDLPDFYTRAGCEAGTLLRCVVCGEDGT